MKVTDSLTDLLRHLPDAEASGNTDIFITGLTQDSRKVEPGMMFVAVNGYNANGADYIPSALAKGASVIVTEETAPRELPAGVSWVKVKDSPEALGRLASAYFGNPSEKLTLVGVTGTNGKTTIATLLYRTVRLLGKKAGLLSTVENKIDTETVHATHTTPDPIALNELLARMVEAGCEFAAMEVSSHAAHQKRIAGLKFAGGIFTNLTRDHLDYHKTFKAYLEAKKSFFDGLGKDAFALVNADDRNGMTMLQNTKASRHTYSIMKEADYSCAVLEDRLDGMTLRFGRDEVETLFSGRFNAQNLAAVFGAGCLLGVPREQMLRILSVLTPVAGRFQCFRSNGITGIVDYAHTPDALLNVLSTVRETLGGKGSIITVFGAGGDRDKGKRPIMGKIAAENSQIAVVTSDNPRSEDPLAIINDILEGIPAEDRGRVTVEPDRAGAISLAVSLAKPGDVILVAGKGHEDYQVLADKTIHFDDREVLAEALKNRKS